MRKIILILLIAIFVIGLQPSIKAESEELLTVEEALEFKYDKSERYVKGYIVGFINIDNKMLKNDFITDENFVIADDPNETDYSKIMVVAPGKELLKKWGLKTNPQNMGKLVAVRGIMSDYIVRPAIRKVKSIEEIQTPLAELKVAFKVDDEKGIIKAKDGVIHNLFVLPNPYEASNLIDKLPEIESKSGYKFIGWNKEFDGTLTEDTVYTALFEKIEPKPIYDEPTKPEEPKPNQPEETEPEPINLPTDNNAIRGSIDFRYLKPAQTQTLKIIENKYNKPYIQGYGDYFRPDEKVTVEESIYMVMRLKGFLELDRFGDKEDLINKAVGYNLISKDFAEKLELKRPIKRGEFAVLVSKIELSKYIQSSFKDTKGHEYENQINQLFANGRVRGYEDGTFRPNGEITRAEIVKILNSIFDIKIEDSKIQNLSEKKQLKVFNDLDETHWAYKEIMAAANEY